MCSGCKPSNKLDGEMVEVGTNDQDGTLEKVIRDEASCVL